MQSPAVGTSEMGCASPTQKRRVKTGCRECRTRRVKCTEGERSPSGVRYPCRQCTKRRRLCYYPRPSTDLVVAVDEGTDSEWVPAALRSATESQVELGNKCESCIVTRRPASVLSNRTVYHADEVFNEMNDVGSAARSGSDALPKSPVSALGLASTAQTSWKRLLDYGEDCDTSNTFDLLFRRQKNSLVCQTTPLRNITHSASLSPRLRISLFDGCLDNPDDHYTMSYLFSGSMKDIGVYGSSRPELDNFQRHLLPFLAHQLSQVRRTERDADSELLYQAAMCLSSAHRCLSTGDFLLSGPKAMEHNINGRRALEKVRKGPRSELSFIAQVTFMLGSILVASPCDFRLADMDAYLESSLGHHVYDVMCLYHVQDCLARGQQPEICASPAGGIDLERTFGASRQIWVLLGQTATLLAQAQTLNSIVGSRDNGVLAAAASALLAKLDNALLGVRAKIGEERVVAGTELYHLALSILVRCEVLHEPPATPTIRQMCERVHEVYACISLAENLVGCIFPLYIASCFCYDSGTRQILLADCQAISARQAPHMPAGPGGIVSEAYWSVIEQSLLFETNVPWRDALASTGRFVVL